MADHTFLHSETFDDGAIVRLASAGTPESDRYSQRRDQRPLQLPPDDKERD